MPSTSVTNDGIDAAPAVLAPLHPVIAMPHALIWPSCGGRAATRPAGGMYDDGIVRSSIPAGGRGLWTSGQVLWIGADDVVSKERRER